MRGEVLFVAIQLLLEEKDGRSGLVVFRLILLCSLKAPDDPAHAFSWDPAQPGNPIWR